MNPGLWDLKEHELIAPRFRRIRAVEYLPGLPVQYPVQVQEPRQPQASGAVGHARHARYE